MSCCAFRFAHSLTSGLPAHITDPGDRVIPLSGYLQFGHGRYHHAPVDDGPRIRVLTVDDHPLLQEGLAAVIRRQQDMHLVGEAASGADGIRLFRSERPDVTLMDLRLPDISGVEATARIRADFPDARIVILTTFDGDVEVRRALDAGARSYVLKSTPLREIV